MCGKTPFKNRLLFLLPVLLAALPGTAAFCQSSPVIRSAAEPGYPPLSIVRDDETADGFSVALLRAALDAMGRKVEFSTGEWPMIRQQLETGELDVLPLVGRTPEREALYDFSIPYLALHGALFVREEKEEQIGSLSDLPGKRIAVMRGDNAEEYVRRAALSDQILLTETFEEAFRLLAAGGADAVIAQKLMGVTLLKTLNLPGIRIAGRPNEEFKQDFSFAVKKGNGPLLALLNEGLSLTIANGTLYRLQQQWMGPALFERGEYRVLIYGGDAAYAPFEFLDEQGRPAGFNIDLMRALATELGLNIAFELGPWTQIRSRIEAGEIDLGAMLYSAGRNRAIDFCTPHAISYQAIFARKGASAPRSSSDLKNARVAVQKHDLMHDYALEQGLESSLTVTPAPDEALRLLAEKQVDFALGAHLQGLYLIKQNGWNHLKAVESKLFAADYCFVVAKDRSELVHQINDGLLRLKQDGRYREIYNQWLGVLEAEYRSYYSQRAFLIALTLVSLASIFISSFILSLRRQVRKHTAELQEANRALKESRIAALNMMEDAVLANAKLEITQFALDHSSDAYFRIHPNGTFAYVNEAACRHLGYTQEEFLQLTIQDLDPDFPADRWPSHWREMKQTGSLIFESRHRRKDGILVPVEIYASFLEFEEEEYICSFAHDITARKQAGKNLQRLLTAIEQSPESVVITNPDGQIEYANPAFEVITGYSPEKVKGLNPKFLKSGQHDQTFYANLWKTITSGKVWEGLMVNKRKDGRIYTEQASISPVRDASGTITGYVAIGRDITEEQAKEEQFRQNQKIQAVGQLAGGIAHDFNNILQAILGFSEILLGRLTPETPEYRNTEEIQKAARKAADLTRQLLAFSRKQAVSLKRLDLNTSVRDAEVLLKLLLGEQIQCCIELPPEPCEIYADHSQITQIIMNLAINARDAMPDGGRLTLAVEGVRVDAHDTATMPEAEPGSFICMSITDTGCGMNPEVKERLFEPFFTTKGVGKGTGLGLSVVYGIVKQNKGWIHVYSEEGHGTSFKIYLPAGRTGGPDAVRSSDPESPYHVRILLVEDDAEMSRLVIRILESAGYEVTSAENAEEALRLFDREEGLFDLLFSDMILPGLGGLELADRIRSRNPDLPILLYSGYRDQRERWTDLESKGYGFLQKPFSVSGLLAAVHDALENNR